MIRALIVDDDRDMRFLVRTTIEVADNGLSVAGEAETGADAIAAVENDRPEVVVLDNRMPGLSGLETARRLLTDHPEMLIILFSACLDATTVDEAAALGIKACVDKTDIHTLPDALWRVAAGA